MNKRERILLLLLWSTFLIRGIFYASLLPIWEGYDEPYHFAYIQYLISTHTTPTFSTPVSREVDTSLHVLPLPWMLTFQTIPKPLYTYEDYWRLSSSQREKLHQEFVDIPKDWGSVPSAEPVSNYEAQQPPLYYLICAPLLLLLRNANLATQVFTLRIAGIILGSLAIPLGYLLVKRIASNRGAWFSILAIAIVMPELYINLARVSNEVPAIIIYTALLYVCLRLLDDPPRLWMLPASGVLIGLGLLTKAYFLTALPALLCLIAFAFWRLPGHRRGVVLFSLIAALLVVALAAPWYLHVHQLSGSWSGIRRDALARQSAVRMLSRIPDVNWLSGVLSIVISHIWFCAWSFLKVGRRWYFGLGGVFVVAVLGIALNGYVTLTNHKKKAISINALYVLISFYLFFCVGLAYDVLLTYVSVGVSSSTGWYMYCLVMAEVTLLYIGLKSLLPLKILRWTLGSLVSVYAALDLFGIHFLMMPYYAGLIGHDVFQQVRPAKLAALIHVGPLNLMQRLLVNKPPALTSLTFSIIWILFLAATICIPAITWALQAETEKEE